MANWNLPTITSGYLDFVTQMNDKFVDAATLLFGSPTNLPVNSIRYNRTSNIFEEWDLTTWNPKVIGLLGGGTGSNTAAGARTNLGLGSMSTQNSNAVNITGGSISGVNFDAGGINTGILALARGGTGASLALGVNGYVMMVAGGTVNFFSGGNISELNASSLVAGTVPDARLSANVALLNRTNNFTSGMYLTSDSPAVRFYDVVQAVNMRRVQIVNTGGYLYIQGTPDDMSASLGYLRVSRDGSAYITGTYTGDGSNITNLNATNIALGTIAVARLGTGGIRDGNNFLRGDNVWAVPAGGSGGGVSFPSGMISMFDVACPAGWTRYAGLDGRFPLGSTSAGATGGSSSHYHTFDVQTDNQGAHSHGFNGATGTAHVIADTNQGNNATYQMQSYQSGIFASTQNHTHHIDSYADVYNVQGSTDGVGGHAHRAAGSVSSVDQYPPWYSVVYCRKD